MRWWKLIHRFSFREFDKNGLMSTQFELLVEYKFNDFQSVINIQFSHMLKSNIAPLQSNALSCMENSLWGFNTVG